MSEAQNKGRKHMAKPTQYFYAATAPCLRTAGLSSPEVPFNAFQVASSSSNKVTTATGVDTLEDLLQTLQTKKAARHKPGEHPLPPEFGEKKELLSLQRDWKPAGYNSNRVATAACFYLIEDYQHKWANANHAWAGGGSGLAIIIAQGMSSKSTVYMKVVETTNVGFDPLTFAFALRHVSTQAACLFQQGQGLVCGVTWVLWLRCSGCLSCASKHSGRGQNRIIQSPYLNHLN